jgi:acetyl esterase/lipase
MLTSAGLAVYLYLLDEGHDPNTIILAGDSAGGGMVLSMLVTLRDQGIALPAGAILISPWVDLTHSFPSLGGDGKMDYIPAHGFVHKPSMSWRKYHLILIWPSTDKLQHHPMRTTSLSTIAHEPLITKARSHPAYHPPITRRKNAKQRKRRERIACEDTRYALQISPIYKTYWKEQAKRRICGSHQMANTASDLRACCLSS